MCGRPYFHYFLGEAQPHAKPGFEEAATGYAVIRAVSASHSAMDRRTLRDWWLLNRGTPTDLSNLSRVTERIKFATLLLVTVR